MPLCLLGLETFDTALPHKLDISEFNERKYRHLMFVTSSKIHVGDVTLLISQNPSTVDHLITLPLHLLGRVFTPHPTLLGLALVLASAQLLTRTLDIKLDLVSFPSHGILELGRLFLGRTSCKSGSVCRFESFSFVLGEGGDLVAQCRVTVDLRENDGCNLFDSRCFSLRFPRLGEGFTLSVLCRCGLDLASSESGR